MNDYSTNPSEYSGASLSQTKSILLKLFLHYSGYQNRGKTGGLAQGSFMQLLKDSKILSEAFTLDSANILVHSFLQKDKTFTLESFCGIFIEISEQIYSEDFQIASERLSKLLGSYVFPLYFSLVSQGLILNLELSLPSNVLELLRIVKNYLQGLYRLYFPWELNSSQSGSCIEKLSEKSFLKLLRRYMIYPNVITRSLFNDIWMNVLEFPPEFIGMLDYEPLGKVFTVFKFVAMIILFANYGGFTSQPLNLYDKVVMVLETMEIYSGSHEISGGSMVVSRNSDPSMHDFSSNEQEDLSSIYNHLKFSGTPKDITIKKIKDLCISIKIPKIEVYDIDLVYKTIGSKSKISYKEFYELMLRLSIKAFPENSLEFLIDFILKSQWYQIKKTKIFDYIAEINDKGLEGPIETWKASVIPFLKYYSDKKTMTFESLLEFTAEFGLFPEVISKKKLDEVFYCFCVTENSEKLATECALQVLEICAADAFIPNLTKKDKLTSVLERLLHSKGPETITLKTGRTRTSDLALASTLTSTKLKAIVKKQTLNTLLNESIEKKY